MVTDTERREVAQRMRETAEGKFDFCAHNIALEIGMDDPSDFDECFDGEHLEAWGRLADLIEPGEPNGHECVPGECLLNVREMQHSTEEEQNEYGAMLEKISVELHPVDRDALLVLADEMDERSRWVCVGDAIHAKACARRIREALGVER